MWKNTRNDGFIAVTNFSNITLEKDTEALKNQELKGIQFKHMENLNLDFSIDDLLFCRSLNAYVKIKGFDEDTKLYKIELIEIVDRPKDAEMGELKLSTTDEIIVKIKDNVCGQFEKELKYNEQLNPETYVDLEATWKS